MKKSIVFSILAAIAAPTWALSTDKSQPIEVHADQFNGDEVKQTAVYSGNVVVDQGSMNLTGARLDLAITPKGYRRHDHGLSRTLQAAARSEDEGR